MSIPRSRRSFPLVINGLFDSEFLLLDFGLVTLTLGVLALRGGLVFNNRIVSWCYIELFFAQTSFRIIERMRGFLPA